ncbi:hypothetical protein OIU79_009378 [Salix purpurea]|uniref:Uncharacterized protein n=1 Tax=Salix purpurea TaxID=77065 RepID=A0A9Q0TKU2_SALPP|nr:hypothetical protein OIU79_009378 [Salix purpurea]
MVECCEQVNIFIAHRRRGYDDTTRGGVVRAAPKWSESTGAASACRLQPPLARSRAAVRALVSAAASREREGQHRRASNAGFGDRHCKITMFEMPAVATQRHTARQTPTYSPTAS